jgi:hypothetical protein
MERALFEHRFESAPSERVIVALEDFLNAKPGLRAFPARYKLDALRLLKRVET